MSIQKMTISRNKVRITNTQNGGTMWLQEAIDDKAASCGSCLRIIYQSSQVHISQFDTFKKNHMEWLVFLNNKSLESLCVGE